MSTTTVNASTSVVLVASSNGPHIVYFPPISTIGRFITVRDTNGYISTGNFITLSTINGASFGSNTSGVNAVQITQPYGFITMDVQNDSSFAIVNTFAFPLGSTAAYVSNVTVSTLNVQNAINIRDLGNGNTQTIFCSTNYLYFNGTEIGDVTSIELISTTIGVEAYASNIAQSRLLRRTIAVGYTSNTVSNINDPTGTIIMSLNNYPWNNVSCSETGGFSNGGVDVVYGAGAGLWVAAGNNQGNASSANTGFLQWSQDGSYWVNSTSPILSIAQGRTRVFWANNLFHALGSNPNGGTSTIMYSVDGKTWNFSQPTPTVPFVNPSGVAYGTGIAFGCNVWVASGVQANSTPYSLVYSLTGSNWSPATSVNWGGSGLAYDVTFSGTRFLAFVQKDIAPFRNIAYSGNGTDWYLLPTTANVNFNNESGYVTVPEGSLVALAVSLSYKRYSVDGGLTWADFSGLPAGAPSKPYWDGSTWWISVDTGTNAQSIWYSFTGSNNWSNWLDSGGFSNKGYARGFYSQFSMSNLNLQLISTVSGLSSNFTVLNLGASTLTFTGGVKIQSASNSVAIGNFAGQLSQASAAVAIGTGAGSNSQLSGAIAIGSNAGLVSQRANSIAIGTLAGASSQQPSAIAIGTQAGQGTQGSNSIAIGNLAGFSSQAPNTIILNATGSALNSATTNAFYVDPVRNDTTSGRILYYNTTTKEITYGTGIVDYAVYAGTASNLFASSNYTVNNIFTGARNIQLGRLAGYLGQASNGIAIGDGTAFQTQGIGGIAIGANAGVGQQGDYAVAVGFQAGNTNQQTNSIAIGNAAGYSLQQANAIAIGNNAGSTSQNTRTVAIGYLAGNDTQNINAIAIGTSAAQYSQNINSIAIGNSAGNSNQQSNAVAIGVQAGQSNQFDGAVAIGAFAGNYNQDSYCVAIGHQAGSNLQKNFAVAIGYRAGYTGQQYGTIAIGQSAGNTNQTYRAIAIGDTAGNQGQQSNSIAIGYSAGFQNQNQNSVAIGAFAGTSGQDTLCVAIGYSAGSNNQQIWSVAVGSGAGQSNQSTNSVAVGVNAGRCNQYESCTAVGPNAGAIFQHTNATAIGNLAGYSNQGTYAIAIGVEAGQTNQQSNSIAIGWSSGLSSQQINSVAIGAFAGTSGQQQDSVAIGTQAGYCNQNPQAVAIGQFAGWSNQAQYGVAIGSEAGRYGQNIWGVAVGTVAGVYNQSNYATAIGPTAGFSNQGTSAVAVGENSGVFSQGSGAIAIGSRAGYLNQGANSIVLNATGFAVNGTTPSAFYVAPIRYTAATGNVLCYNTTTNEVIYASNLTLANGIQVTAGSVQASDTVSGNTAYGLDRVLTGAAGIPGRVFVLNNTNSGQVAIGCYSNTVITPGDLYFQVAGGTGSVGNISGTYGTISDSNLKENIQTSRNYLDDLAKIRVVNYNFISSTEKYLGVIAQEVQQILPGLVDTTQSRLSVKMSIFIPMLITAVQSLHSTNQGLQSTIQLQQEQINRQQQQLNQIFSTLNLS